MASLLPAGTVVAFRPGPGWAWVGFDGRVPLSAAFARAALVRGSGAVDTDFVRLAEKLVGKSYAAAGHDAPGQVTTAVVTIDAGTLTERVRIEGRRAGTTATTGTFRVAVVPSRITGPPTVPDAAPERAGTWAVCPPADDRTDV